MTQKRIKEIYASKDSLLLLNHALHSYGRHTLDRKVKRSVSGCCCC
jgi:hypothetical protein